MNHLNLHTRQNCTRRCMFLIFLLLSMVPLLAQQREVDGLVCDSNGDPLIGVNVMAKGDNGVGTITDFEGKFHLKVKTDATLVFSYIGYISLEKKLTAADSFLKVTMKEDAELLEEVVVVGYGTKRKGGVSAAVSSVDSKDITRSTSTTASGAIVGKVAGITARQKTGEPGGSPNIQIRNLGAPLYVIDGIMTDAGSFNNLDINDIDNISVLKDGAAAIYGMKAANGVILVTTKSGRKNAKPTVSLNSYIGWQQWTTYPELMNAYEYSYAQAMQKVNRGVLSDPAAINNTRNELEKWKSGVYNPETGEDYRSFDWYDNYVSQAAPQHYVNASISGGGEKMTYYLSASYINQDAVLKDFNFNRVNVQGNFNMELSKYLKVGYQLTAKIEDKSGPALTPIDPAAGGYQLIRNSIFGLLPTMRPYANDNPNYINYLVAHDSRNLAGFDKEHAGAYSHVWRTVRNTFTVDYQTPLKGLSAKGLFSYFFANNNQNRNEKGYKEYTYDRKTDSYVVMYDKAEAGGAKRSRIRDNYYDINGQFLLNYDNTFGKHNITGTAGFEFYQRQQNFLRVEQSPVDNPFVDLVGSSENNKVEERKIQNSTASFVFRAGYNYDQKYIVDFTGRYDGSWKFPSGKRWAFFPSVSAAWRLSEEGFFKEWGISRWLTNVKLRISYGEMGDDGLGNIYPDFAFLSGYNYNQGAAYIPSDPFASNDNKNIIGTKVKGVPITTLSWMTASIFDIGIELGFLNNRLGFEFDVFKRKREGIAATPDDIYFPEESGLSVLPQNLNTDMTVGLDVALKWNDKVNDFSYFAGVNLTLARAKNGKIYGEKFFNAMDRYFWGRSERWASVINGGEAGLWMYETMGTFQNQEQIDNYPVNIDGKNNTTLLPGDPIYKDVNNDGIINDHDRRPLGYAGMDFPFDESQGNKQPLMSMGISFGGEWKGIDVAVDFAGGFMNTWCPNWFSRWGSGVNYVANGFKYNTLDVWHHEDILDPTSPWVPGAFPAFRGDETFAATNANTFYSKNVKYLRLRDVVVGYTLPVNWTRKALIQKCRFYFEGSNLFSFDNMKTYGIDPEVSGVQGADYPVNRVYTVGVNLTF